MKFKDEKTGRIFDGVGTALDEYCGYQRCENCKLGKFLPTCIGWAKANLLEFAKLAGYEIIKDELTEAIIYAHNISIL